MRSLPTLIAALFAICLAAGPALADSLTKTVKFPRGANGTTIRDQIRGYDTINYRIGVSAGQRMSVNLDTSNRSAYFNVTAPGASEALFNGSIAGNGTSFIVPSSGNYVVEVYLMRNAARRNETARFELGIYVENARDGSRELPAQRPAIAPPPAMGEAAVDTRMMQRYCSGEAAGQYGTRPSEITVNAAMAVGQGYVVQGWFDGSGDTQFFNCYFDAAGHFTGLR